MASTSRAKEYQRPKICEENQKTASLGQKQVQKKVRKICKQCTESECVLNVQKSNAGPG